MTLTSYAEHAGQFLWSTEIGTPTYAFKERFYSDQTCNRFLSENSTPIDSNGWTWLANVVFSASSAIVCSMAGPNCLLTQSHKFVTLDSNGNEQFSFDKTPCFAVNCTSGTDCINSDVAQPIPTISTKINTNLYRKYMYVI